MLNLTLRAPEPEDTNIIYIWENSSDESHSSLRTGPLSRHAIAEFIDRYDGEIYTQGALRYMIVYEGETVGTIDIFDYDHRNRHAFVGIYIAPRFRRKGLATIAVGLVEKELKLKTGMHSLAALVAEDNKPSRALFEKCGYHTAGKLQSWFSAGEKRLNALLYQHIL